MSSRTLEKPATLVPCAHHFLHKDGTIYELQTLLRHRGIDMNTFMYGGIDAKNDEKTMPYDF
jgi:hypothetical protein